ncbi:MAG: Export protein [Microgenomates group bacterium GW2011_GWC1_39_7b]|uniref:Export protein n=3 Tax=Candidatus Woeseibacteriota TaxID=1752722 RepID=A0A0G0P0V8_9BACT|nr:MAG: Export protein [Candidatus Woesebacteria bacterium GW2011_GWB1_39_10]KKR26896.1 MAG: Export protein [Microgenomates group bacterium GW2011_GWC1_39_7b]KKR73747.1 MAG: Export protein [Candidatus Woesebacteria bacterium GW2011_GWA2_40_7]KKS90711.1 MAG: Export protein [Candidatus Woesebacteria bacterium GW2011_GWA1_43_12]
MGYFKDTLKGLSWMTAFRVLYRLIGVIRIAIIAHILTPFSLGVFGVVTIILGFLEIITETGINIFLIQEKEDIDNYIDTAWVVSIIRGLLISILIFITASPISGFFNSPGSKALLYIASLVPLIRGLINPSIVKFQKELQFNKEFLYRISVFSIECLVSVLGVIILQSAYGMVLGLVASAVFEVFYTFIVARPWPKFAFHKVKIQRVVERGKWVTLFGIFDYFYTQSDNVVVGKILGIAPLGIYQNAYKISTAPLTEVGDIFYRVTFPIFSKISGEAARLKSAFIKNTLANFVLMTTAGIIVFVFAAPIVNILFGKGWESAIPVVKLLSVLGVVRGIASSTNSLLVAKEKQKYSAIVTIVSTLGLWVTIIPLTQTYGIIGAGASAIIGTLISLPFTGYFIFKTLKT